VAGHAAAQAPRTSRRWPWWRASANRRVMRRRMVG
jgi:hypothetical protein